MEAAYAALAVADRDPHAPSASPVLIDALAQQNNVLPARAAEVVAGHRLTHLTDDVAAAFGRFIRREFADKGCQALVPLSAALAAVGCRDAVLLRAGLAFRQPERPPEPPRDSAAGVRANCAQALALLNPPGVTADLADLLADAVPACRAGAARALGVSGMAAGVPVLRLRVRLGDDADVLLEAMASLLALDAPANLPLVRQVLLGEAEPAQEAAALALAEHRRPEALGLLRDWFEACTTPRQVNVCFTAMASMRTDQAVEFLLSQITHAPKAVSAAAEAALRPQLADPALAARVEEARRRR